MVTNSTSPPTSVSATILDTAIPSDFRSITAAAGKVDASEIMSTNIQACPYPRRGRINCVEDASRLLQIPQAAAAADRTSSTVGAAAAAADVPWNAALDFERIGKCVSLLEASGWYYGRLTWREATDLLKSTAVGTFLVRDSSDPAYLFALSVQTECGPTSIRIHYTDGQFKLDAEESIACRMPLFDCAVQLIDFYVRLSSTDKRRCHVWLDETGRRDRTIFLDRPLYHRVTPLQHLCRLAVNANYTLPLQRIPLPKTVTNYIDEYPYGR